MGHCPILRVITIAVHPTRRRGPSFITWYFPTLVTSAMSRHVCSPRHPPPVGRAGPGAQPLYLYKSKATWRLRQVKNVLFFFSLLKVGPWSDPKAFVDSVFCITLTRDACQNTRGNAAKNAGIYRLLTQRKSTTASDVSPWTLVFFEHLPSSVSRCNSYPASFTLNLFFLP